MRGYDLWVGVATDVTPDGPFFKATMKSATVGLSDLALEAHARTPEMAAGLLFEKLSNHFKELARGHTRSDSRPA